MLKKSYFYRSFRLLLMSLILTPMFISQSYSQYCQAYIEGFKENFICEFQLAEINYRDCEFVEKGYKDFTKEVYEMNAGETYEAKLVFTKLVPDINPGSVYIWFDFNRDYKFNMESEAFVLEKTGKDVFTGDITIPSYVEPGETRMRVRMFYEYEKEINPCGGLKYGDILDYTINIQSSKPKLADAQITQITSPSSPFLAGSYPIVATLSSNNEVKLTSCQIDWWVNGVFQKTVNWNGNLVNGNTASVNLGDYNFSYPENETIYGPFNIRITVKNVNGEPQDADPKNDTYNVSVSPTINDCGAIGFFGPAEGFGAGVTKVRARVMNYAAKPLTSVKVNWKIDGVAQTPKLFSGLYIKQNQYQDLDMGTFEFYNKTPLGPFSVEVWTESPNNIKDENPNNDSYKGGIGPSLTAGIYYAGGLNPHFSSPAEAASYINSSGIFGAGTVIIEIRPGTYNGQIIFNNKLANDNPLIFRSSTYSSRDVILGYNPTTANNFVLQLVNIKNIRFENITFANFNSNISNAGRIVFADKIEGLAFHKVVFNGVMSSPKNNAYNIITANNCNNISLTENEFNNGSISFWSSAVNSPKIYIFKNNFTDFSWYGINGNVNNLPNKADDLSILENNFKLIYNVTTGGAINSFNGSLIKNNIISNLKGTGNSNDAVIKIAHSTINPNVMSVIEDNLINNCSDMNGIQISNSNVMINQNSVIVSQSANYACSILDIANSMGYAGNNMLIGANIPILNIDSSPYFNLVYNTASTDLNSKPVIRVTGNSSKIFRNIFMNNGNGIIMQIASANNIDQNVLFSKGSILANINNKLYQTIDNIHNDGLMIKSSFANIEFFSPNDLHLKIYDESLVFNEPLFDNTNILGKSIENYDFDGESRDLFFAGMDEIKFNISIASQTEGFVDCEGSSTNFLTVTAAIGYNAKMTYQWEHDGVQVKGETEPIMYFHNLDHSQAGVYRCAVKGPGNSETVYTRPVTVYVARPTEITRQPIAQKVPLGGKATLNFTAHVNGKKIEDAVANDEVKIQWFKYVDEANDITMKNNNFVSGSNSNYMTLNNFRKSDQGEYYAIIDGLCGRVKTERVLIEEGVADIIIVEEVQAQAKCEATDITFSVEATTSSNEKIVYQWSKDGIELNDEMGKITGTNSNTLKIKNIATSDAGEYSVLIKLEDNSISKTSSANLDVLTAPIIITQPEDMIAEIGKSLEFIIEAKNAKEYKWYKDGELFLTTEGNVIVFTDIYESYNGEYYVVALNDCGETQSETFTVTVSVGTTSVVEVSKNGYSLLSAIPNPANGISMIGFSVPTQSYIKLSLTDLSGASRTVLAEGTYEIGTHSINIDVNKLNLSSGTYFYYLEANGVVLSQKLVVIK